MRELTAQERSRLAELRLTDSDLAVHWDLNPEKSFEDATMYLVELRQKLGIAPTVQDANPTTDGLPAVSTPVTELPESDPNHVAVGENGWPVAEAPVVEEAAPESVPAVEEAVTEETEGSVVPPVEGVATAE